MSKTINFNNPMGVIFWILLGLAIVMLILTAAELNAQTPVPSQQIWTTSNTVEQDNKVCINSVDNLFSLYTILLVEINKEQQFTELVFYTVIEDGGLFALDTCIEYDYKPWCEYQLKVGGGGNGYYYYLDVILEH